MTASIVDADGTLLPDARVGLDFAVSGDGELTAVGTGDPTDVSSFHQGKRTTWHGESTALTPLPLIFSYKYENSLCGAGVAVAILRPTTTSAGSIKLTASASGLQSASVTVTTTAAPAL